jgi:hypothetical protein
VRSRQAPVVTFIALAVGAALIGCGQKSDPAPAAPAPAPVEPIKVTAEQVDNVMRLWRTAILNRDPEGVQTCDLAFMERPAEFLPALVNSARTDGDERVRAFSTRVLGKLRNHDLTPVFRELAEDRQQHVRANAVWALEQLSAAARERAGAAR